jgi:hypothetical protein
VQMHRRPWCPRGDGRGAGWGRSHGGAALRTRLPGGKCDEPAPVRPAPGHLQARSAAGRVGHSVQRVRQGLQVPRDFDLDRRRGRPPASRRRPSRAARGLGPRSRAAHVRPPHVVAGPSARKGTSNALWRRPSRKDSGHSACSPHLALVVDAAGSRRRCAETDKVRAAQAAGSGGTRRHARRGTRVRGNQSRSRRSPRGAPDPHQVSVVSSQFLSGVQLATVAR